MTGSELLDACITPQANKFNICSATFKIVKQQLLIYSPVSLNKRGTPAKQHCTCYTRYTASRMLQVKDALGSWKDVRLGPHEVAIMFGQTATQASAGLFRPAIYRVVSITCCLPSVADYDIFTYQLVWPFDQQITLV